MSSSVMSTARKSLRTEALLTTAVDPITFSMPGVCLEAIVEAITILEKCESRNCQLPELVAVVRGLTSALKKAGVSHGFTKKDLVIWLTIEVMETDVGVEDVMEWLNHRPTLDEIVFAAEPDSMMSLLKINGSDGAWQRYHKLLKVVLG